MKPDYYSVLISIIEATAHDPAQLRSVVYQLARVQLKKELYQRYSDLGSSGMKAHLLQLDAAILCVENELARHDRISDFSARPPGSFTRSYDAALYELYTLLANDCSVGKDEIPNTSDIVEPAVAHRRMTPISPSHQEHVQESTARGLSAQFRAEDFELVRYREPVDHEIIRLWEALSQHKSTLVRAGNRMWISVCLMFLIAIATVSSVAIFTGHLQIIYSGYPQSPARAVIADSAGGEPPQSNPLQQKQRKQLPVQSALEAAPPILPYPLPTTYGVYAVNGGVLSELGPLPIRVPDQRIAISGKIIKPPSITLADGNLSFIIFGHELSSSSLPKVTVRVVARIARATTFDSSGKAKMAGVDEAWVIRNNVYDMKVQPLRDNPDMTIIQPGSTGFEFPAGRYALVVKGIGYDFSVAGPITESAQCLERTEVLDGPVYSECRNPQPL